MYDGYLSFAGVEIVNAARTNAYIESIGIIGSTGLNCDVCPDLASALGGVTYFDPASDNAPWYDHNVPESALVAGYQMIVPEEGLGATGTRQVASLAAGGGVVGAFYRQPRSLNVTFRAVAASPAASAYAVAWLSKQMRGTECSPLSSGFSRVASTQGCGSDVLCMLTSCPRTPVTLQESRVNLYDVGVTAGPTVTQTRTTDNGQGGCILALTDVDVTFTAGDPSWYYIPSRIVDVNVGDFYVGSASYDVKATYASLGCGSDVCTDAVPAGCVSTAGPAMVAPPTPCVGATSFTANHYSIPLDFSAIPTTMDLVPQLYYAGSPITPATTSYEGPVVFQMRRATADAPCGTVANPCDVPIEIFTAQQRRDITGILDWRRKKAYRVMSVEPVCPYPVFTRELAPFTWPTLVCADSMCLDVFIDADNDGRSARVVLDVMRRVDGIA